MSRSKSTTSSRRGSTTEPHHQSHLENDEDDFEVESEIDAESEISETEKELERAVFGDSAEFGKQLQDFSLSDVIEGANEDESTGLEGLEEADLFTIDLGPSQDSQLVPTPQSSDTDNTLQSKHPAAWEDSDDERMMVSLASVPRLRKLRRTEAEDVINGKEYSKRLRKQFELLNPVPDWAREVMNQPARKKRRLSEDGASEENGSEEEMDLDDDLPSAAPLSKLLRNASSLVRQPSNRTGKRRKIRPEVIDIQRTKDIALTQPSAITSLSFHPSLPLLLSSGPSSTLFLHHITPSPPAPAPNPLLTSLHIKGTPLSTTAFHPNDSRIFLSARRRYFHVWDLDSGRIEKVTRVYGHQHEQRSMERFKISPDGQYMALLGSTRKGGGVINILSAGTLQWICQVRVESRGGIADFCWWRSSTGLCIAGKNGEITEWSVIERTVVSRWQDEGAVGTTTIALGGQHEVSKSAIGTDKWVVIGSSSGIVNIYDRREWLASPSTDATQPIPLQPKPTRVFDHLTTPISHLTFSHDGQILAMASRWKHDAMRLVHLPSCTVFRNWPTKSTPLGRITGVALAPGEVVGEDVHSLLAVANEQGKIRLWEIR